MGTEVSTQNQFSTALTTELENNRAALPADFNIARYVQNALALLNGNDQLQKFAKQYGTSQIKANLMRAACLGLDAMNSEIYFIPYGSTLNFMPSYKGMTKMAQKYATRPIKSIYAKCVRQGDEFEETIHNGEPSINYKAIPFNNADIIGAFAVCQYQDGGIVYEVMSKDDIDQCRNQSKSKGGLPWQKFYSEMAKKTVLRRLCKSLSIDMDAKAVEAFDSGLEIETDVKEQVKNEIQAEANQVEFDVDDFEIDEFEDVIVE